MTSTECKSAIGKFGILRRTWDEHDCEANAGQLLGKNKDKHRQIAAESLENYTNHENNKILKLKLYQYAEGICFKQQNCGKSWSNLQRHEEEVNFSLKIVK